MNPKFSYLLPIIYTIISLTSCSANKPPQKISQGEIQAVTQHKNYENEEKIYRSIAKAKKKLYKIFEQQKKELMNKMNTCQNQLQKLYNTSCKPEKIVEVKKENVYVLRTINFEKHKKLLHKKLYSIKSLKKRKEIAEKLFFIYLSEKNWTKAYDIYKLYIDKNKPDFSDILLAYIYLNNAEQNEAKTIFNNYIDEDNKPLKIKLIKFCKKILSYGIFEPKPNHLEKGKNAILYLLLDNVKLVKENNGFRINLSVRISLNRGKERFVLLDEENTTSIYQHSVSDILLPIRLQIPLNLSYNYYFMKVNIVDLNSNMSVNKTVKVKIMN